jgi:cyclophilin family peptidyl-prolyl cis-trans isomerase
VLGAQGGDPTGTGRGGESIYGEKFEDEITRVRQSLDCDDVLPLAIVLHAE